MALADFAAYKAMAEHPAYTVPYNGPGALSTSSRPVDLWTSATPPGVAPTTPVVPTSATAGCIQTFGVGASGKELKLVGGVARLHTAGGAIMLADRLSHQAGLSGTVNSAQTTNLPTAALTRFTDGEGVMAMLTIYTTIGTTATTVTVSYTNQAGTAGRTSPPQNIGTAANGTQGRGIAIPLAAGDTGIRSVESVTLAATTGTVGNFGVTLYKPLAYINLPYGEGPGDFDLLNGLIGFESIPDNACLFPVLLPAGTTSPNCMFDFGLV